MRHHPRIVIALLAIVSSATHAQSITVTPASAAPLAVSTAVAGQEPMPVSASGGTYRLVQRRNRGVGSITARLAAPLPSGATLTIRLVSPGGTAQSVGSVQLTTSAQPVITGLPNRNTTFGSRAITYTFSATSAAGAIALRSVDVVLELAP